MGATRPQTPRRSPRQAFGGNFEEHACGEKIKICKTFSENHLHDYMPVICG